MYDVSQIFHASNDRFVVGSEFNYVTRFIRKRRANWVSNVNTRFSRRSRVLEKSIARESMNNIARKTLNLFCRALSTHRLRTRNGNAYYFNHARHFVFARRNNFLKFVEGERSSDARAKFSSPSSSLYRKLIVVCKYTGIVTRASPRIDQLSRPLWKLIESIIESRWLVKC